MGTIQRVNDNHLIISAETTELIAGGGYVDCWRMEGCQDVRSLCKRRVGRMGH